MGRRGRSRLRDTCREASLTTRWHVPREVDACLTVAARVPN